jgi:DNA-binding NtrC family response regulator
VHPLLKVEIKVSDERKRTIFVVDNEPIIVGTSTAILDRFGFSTQGFTNPLDVLQASNSECPDLLLSDVVMPELSGFDLAIKFCERCPKCKILLFSGQTETSTLLEFAREAGHNFMLLAKPIHPSDLLIAIEALLPSGEQSS